MSFRRPCDSFSRLARRSKGAATQCCRSWNRRCEWNVFLVAQWYPLPLFGSRPPYYTATNPKKVPLLEAIVTGLPSFAVPTYASFCQRVHTALDSLWPSTCFGSSLDFLASMLLIFRGLQQPDKSPLVSTLCKMNMQGPVEWPGKSGERYRERLCTSCVANSQNFCWHALWLLLTSVVAAALVLLIPNRSFLRSCKTSAGQLGSRAFAK